MLRPFNVFLKYSYDLLYLKCTPDIASLTLRELPALYRLLGQTTTFSGPENPNFFEVKARCVLVTLFVNLQPTDERHQLQNAS